MTHKPHRPLTDHLLRHLARMWREYCDYHSQPIVITTAGILGPIHPDWVTKEE